MSLIEKIKKVKKFVDDNKKELFISASFILVAFISFGLGRMSALEEQKYPIWFEEVGEEEIVSPAKTFEKSLGGQDKTLVGSKNSNLYHYTWCSGAKRIKEENKIFFNSKEEAEKAGYKPAGNCEGL